MISSELQQYQVSRQARQLSQRTTALLGIGTAVPAYSGTQSVICGFMEKVMRASRIADRRKLSVFRRIYERSGIERRHLALSDYFQDEPELFEFYPKNQALEPFPGTAARMQRFERECVPLAAAACRAALRDARLDPALVTHLLVSTCTGFFAPGPDVFLVRELGLPASVERTCLNFMGCYAGLSGLRIANDIVLGDSRAVVLHVCVELCSLHYQKDTATETLVANALFADGAAAAIYGAATGTANAGGALARVLAARCSLSPDSLNRMSWRIGDTGYVMTLDPTVPGILREAVPQFLRELAGEAGVGVERIRSWAVHPGGRKILNELEESVGAAPGDLNSSYSILRDYGNMSSATILFVLDRELRRTSCPSGLIAAMAFGPGLTIEGCLMERGQRT